MDPNGSQWIPILMDLKSLECDSKSDTQGGQRKKGTHKVVRKSSQGGQNSPRINYWFLCLYSWQESLLLPITSITFIRVEYFTKALFYGNRSPKWPYWAPIPLVAVD